MTLCAGFLLRRYPQTVTNFRGTPVMVGYGLYLAVWALAPAVFTMKLDAARTLGFVIPLASLAALGYLDDRLGSHGRGGFKGHILAFVRDRRITTGFAKLIGGGVAALIGASMLKADDMSAVRVICDGTIIALCANFVNLLDLRPGRAGYTFLLFWVLVLGGVRSVDYAAVSIPAALATALLVRKDSRGEWIMGDVGSNTLGAMLGIGIVIGFGVWQRIAVLVALILVHAFAERYSISEAIQNSRILSAIDRRLGVR